MKKCVAYGAIDSQDGEVFQFGVEAYIKSRLNMLLPLVLSIFFNCFLQMFLFIALYCRLRRYAGGYHSKSEVLCFILSQLMIMGAMIIILFSTEIPSLILNIIVALSALTIILLGPVETRNNPLTSHEKILYKKKNVFYTAIIFVSYVISHMVFTSITSTLASVLVVVAILVIQGYTINRMDALAKNNKSRT